MASGKELPIGGAAVAPLNPGKGEGNVAGDGQPGEGGTPEGAPEGSVAQPGTGEPGGQVAQPGEGEGAVVKPATAEPGQTAEERIQSLAAEVKDLKSQLSAVEDLQDLADELDETLSNIQNLAIVQTDSPAPPGGAQPAAKPTEVPQGVEAKLDALANSVAQLQGVIQKGTVTPEERSAYQNFQSLEDGLLKKADITDEKEVEIVKELINTTMDKGNLDWRRPRVAKRVIRGAIDKYNDMKSTMLGTTVRPGKEPTPSGDQPPTPKEAVRHAPAPEQEGIDPLDQAAQELGPIMEQLWGKKGGGII